MRTFILAFALSLVFAVQASAQVQGDLDGDSFATYYDYLCIEDMVLGAAPATAAGDVDGDGFVNVNDLLFFATFLMPASIGDVNGDGVIDGWDLRLLLRQIAAGATTPAGDVNGDGSTDVTDAQLLAKILNKL